MASAAKKQSSELKQFANNVKKTALGVKFAKTVFTNPDSLSPMQVTNICKALGLKLSQDQQLTVAGAQLIISGNATMTAYQVGNGTTKAAQSAQNVTSAAVATITGIGMQNGWFDSDSASLINIGTDVAMIIASCGTNVQAWISLCMDLSSAVSAKQNLADFEAAKDLQAKLNATVGVQAKIAGQTFEEFQKGKIGVFGLITKMAYEAPYLFPQVVKDNSPLKEMFPELSLIPTVRETIQGYGQSEIWGNWPWPAQGRYVISRTEGRTSQDVDKIGKDFGSKDEAAEFIYNALVIPWASAYYIADREIVKRGNASIDTVALLSMVGADPAEEISENFDYASLLVGANLTPNDLGDKNLLSKVSNAYLDYYFKDVDQTFRETGISTGYENPGIRMVQSTKDQTRKWIKQIEASNNISEFISFPPFYEALKEYFDFDTVSFERDPSLGGKINEKFSTNQVRAWRKVSNYISVLNVVDQFRTDPYLKQTVFASNIPPFLPSPAQFESRLRKLQMLSVVRNSEIVSNNVIASILNVPTNKLKVLNENKPNEVKVYGYK